MQPKGFSTFQWLLALFCLPSALWPLGLFISAKFEALSNLTPSQVTTFSILFWVYPVVLLAIAGVLHKIHRHQPALARFLLAAAFVAFYSVFYYIVQQF